MSADSDWLLVEHKLCRRRDDRWEAGRRKQQQKTPNKTNKMSAAAAKQDATDHPGEDINKQTAKLPS